MFLRPLFCLIGNGLELLVGETEVANDGLLKSVV